MEAAFPFLAILVGATVLLEHLAKLKDAGEKTAAEWGHIETESTKALNKMGDELLTVEMQADRLSGNNLAALHKQLLLIDHQSMSELEMPARSATVFANMVPWAEAFRIAFSRSCNNAARAFVLDTADPVS